MSAEQSGQSHLPAWRSPVIPLAASQATSHLQDGVLDVQSALILSATILKQPDPESCSCSTSAKCAVTRCPAAVHLKACIV